MLEKSFFDRENFNMIIDVVRNDLDSKFGSTMNVNVQKKILD